MPLKTYKPTTPGRRHMTSIDYSGMHRGKPHKKLVEGRKEQAGRNNLGRITTRHQGAGNKRRLRIIDFVQQKFDVPGRIERTEYDPFRSVFIGLVVYKDGDRRYLPLPEGAKVGDTVISSTKRVDLALGNRMPLKHIPTGVPISLIELAPGKGAKVVRGAGNLATIVAKEGPYAQVRLPSGEIRLFDKESAATIGQLSNLDHANVRLSKAGRSRWMRIRPSVLGKNMNPVDHPHGGGEGHSPIGLKHPKTPWGKPALGVKTRKKTKRTNRFIVKPRKGRLTLSS